MYGIAVSVGACLRGGTRVDVAWSLDPGLTPGFDPADAVAITPGGGRLGSLLGGAIDSRVVEIGAATPTTGRVVTVEVNPVEAGLIGVEPGTSLRVMVAPADSLPDELWDRLLDREPIKLVTRLDADLVTAASIAPNDDGVASVEFEADSVTTSWSPRTTFVVMGSGPMADAVAAGGEFAGWNVERSAGPEAAIGFAAALSPIDGLVVVGHDVEGTGRVMQAALGSRAGYLGAVGPRSVHSARLDWLAYRGVDGTDRIHAPAGLDIGARSPSEVAIAVVAEMIAARTG